MKTNFSNIVIVSLVATLAGVTLLIGIQNTVQVATAPIRAQLIEMEASQRVLAKSLSRSGNAQLSKQLSALQNQLKSLQGRLGRPQAPAPAAPQEDMNKVYTIDIGNTPVNGKKDAPITIVDFADFQCPFCARFYPPLKEVLKAYPDQVKVVIKNFPLSFHPNARPAAKMALAANEQGKYYEMADLLMQNGADVSDAKVKDYAKELKLDYKKLMNDLKAKDAAYEKIVTDDANLGQQVDVQGTPTFFLNGKKTNARDFNGYKTEIDKILAAK
ncbi:MAG: thioredoxin domain-containing protein [Candidatus Omnitrophica bacterium]|nr:thioredoxin domain-containing protein [Candidatus Omnitrophota bacterium]